MSNYQDWLRNQQREDSKTTQDEIRAWQDLEAADEDLFIAARALANRHNLTCAQALARVEA